MSPVPSSQPSPDHQRSAIERAMKYRTIVLDPPWLYENQRGTQTRAKRGRKGVTAAGHYPCMSNAEIAALPIAELADKECALYLWVTNPRMFGHVNRRRDPVTPLDMVEGWGFTYKTLLTWVKTGAPGMGFAFRCHTEHVIYAVKGRLSIPSDKRESNVFVAPRRGHSQKPESFYDLVERVSPSPRLEMFARRNRLGWDTWGNEALNHVELNDVPGAEVDRRSGKPQGGEAANAASVTGLHSEPEYRRTPMIHPEARP